MSTLKPTPCPVGALPVVRCGAAQYYSTQMSVQMLGVIPAKDGIHALLLDSGQKHAGMTDLTTDALLCGAA
jgi:hypothetical protein